jgi:hypothetical protein
MRLRFLIGSLLVTLLPAVHALGQVEHEEQAPVTIQEIRRALTHTPEIPEQLQKTNLDLIEAINSRGVDFVLLPEEEWALTLRDASPELIETIRKATPPEERDRLLKIKEQEGLYYAFVNNYSLNDVASRRIAIDAGREFVRRYGSDANVAEIVAFFQRAVPALERSLRFIRRPSRGRPRRN